MTSRQLNAVFMLFKWVLCAIAVYVLSCLPCFAQFGVEQPMFQLTAIAPYSPTSEAGLGYWWDSTVLLTNVNVTNWIDKIQGSILTNGANSLRPTNSLNTGVGFNGTTVLTNTSPISLTGVNSAFAVIKWTNPNQTLSPIFSAGSGASYYVFRLSDSTWASGNQNGARWGEGRGATTHWQCEPNNQSIPTNQLVTLCVATSSGSPARRFYTNGVDTTTTSISSSDIIIQYVGADSQGWNFIGYIKHLLVFTNIQLSATSVSNLNYWAQNQ